MSELNRIGGTAVPADGPTPVLPPAREAAMDTGGFGGPSPRVDSRERAPGDREAHDAPGRCCVCGEEIPDHEDGAFGACADCLDDAHRDADGFIEQVFPGRERA